VWFRPQELAGQAVIKRRLDSRSRGQHAGRGSHRSGGDADTRLDGYTNEHD